MYRNTANNDVYLNSSRQAAKYWTYQGGHYFSVAPSGTADTAISWTTAMTIANTGDVEVETGNLVIGTSGKGIDFSATANGSGTMTSEVLDDYETGTWTPRVYQNGSNEITSPIYASGTYTKIGNQLHLTGYFYKNTSPTSASGTWEIWNLPYAIKTAVAGSYQYASAGYNRINNSYLGFNGAGGHGSRWQSNSASRLILYGEGYNNSWTTGNIEFSFNATFTV
jgi:hypothetical protein